MPDGSRVEWPLDYRAVWRRRQNIMNAYRRPEGPALARRFYPTEPERWFEDWVSTYDPRNASDDGELPATLPFILFPRQRELVRFIYQCLDANAPALIEKARDMGATWICCGISVHLWLYRPGSSVGWGSRKEQLVDKIGDPDSIFEKMRMIIRKLPRSMRPRGFDPSKHMSFMKIINPATGATITGEAGDNIGRGGRKLIYFKDESAHYERPERIEAALSDTTRVPVDISSVNGLGNVFHRKREAGEVWEPGKPINPRKTNVFVMDWRDHPGKDQAWYDQRRQRAVDDGLLHIFAQEVDRDYSASVEGVVIPAEWVLSAIDADKALGFEPEGMPVAGLDVADEGLDKHALAIRKGSCLLSARDWGERGGAAAARVAIDDVRAMVPLSVEYDCIGVGATVKEEVNRLIEEHGSDGQPLLPKGIEFRPWNAAAGVLWPKRRVVEDDLDTPLNEDFFANLKAQGWWSLRRRFELTHRARTEDILFDPDDLISIPSTLPGLQQLRKELSQATMSKGAKLKLVIDKAPEGTRSPNMADAVVMAFFPASQGSYDASLGWV